MIVRNDLIEKLKLRASAEDAGDVSHAVHREKLQLFIKKRCGLLLAHVFAENVCDTNSPCLSKNEQNFKDFG